MILEAVLIGIVAWVFVIILMEEGMIFGWWWWPLNKLPDWFAKPLGKCEYCMAGQMALWYYLYAHLDNYDFCYHIVYISLSILTVKILNQVQWI
jgi:hypothetical protein